MPLDIVISDLAELLVRDGRRVESTIRLTKAAQAELGPLLDSLTSVTPPTERLTLRRRSRTTNGEPDALADGN